MSANLFYAIFGAPHPSAPRLADGFTCRWGTDPWGYAELTVYRPDGKQSFQLRGRDGGEWILNGNGGDLIAFDTYQTWEQVLAAAQRALPRAFAGAPLPHPSAEQV